MKHVRSICSAFAAIVLAAANAGAATTMYSNVTNFSALAYAQGGVVSSGGSAATAYVADDITAGAGLGGLPVNSITFSLANLGASAVSANVILAFYRADGSGSTPGTLIGAFDTGTTSIASGVSLRTVTNSSAGGLFTMPTGLFWAGIYFTDNGGLSGATPAQLGTLGQGIFSPPTIGTSVDAFFQSTSAAPSGNNPAGSIFFFGGNPTANFGWAFSSNVSTAAVPLPTSAMTGLSLLGISALSRRRA